MHAHLLGIALGLLASAWLPDWFAPPLSVAMCGGLLLLAAFGVWWIVHWNAAGWENGTALATNLCLFLFAFGAAGLFGLHRVDSQLAHRLPISMHGLIVTAEIEVESLPSQSGPATRFDARLVSMGADWDVRQPPPKRLRITWFNAATRVRAGDKWCMQLKLRSPVGNLNRTGFDYEAWLLSNKIDALASVQSGTLRKRHEGFSFQNRRKQLRSFFLARDTRYRGALLALSTGDGSHMEPEDWRLFRNTGTIHLMVISGLHVGLVAFYSGVLGFWLFRFLAPLSRVLPAQTAGVVCGVVAAGGFSLLCGWTLPVQRALIMVCCAAIALVFRRRLRLMDAWLLAFILVLVQAPYASLASGFWLSFGAVALLMLLSWNAPMGTGRGYWIRILFRTQVFLSLGMAPLLLIVIRELPLVSPLANLIAVPVTTLIIVPSVLLASLCIDVLPSIAGGLLDAAGAVFSAQAWLLEWLGNLSPLQAVTINPTLAAVCLLSFLCVFFPAAAPWRLLLLLPGVLLAIVVIPASDRPQEGEFRLTLFDVGQGLSVFVETQNRSLLYDAGARYADGFDLGEAVVAPAVWALGWRHVDEFVLSHWDNDHAGGASAVIDQLGVRSIIHSPDASHAFPLGDSVLRDHPVRPCRAGDTWNWDQVQFTVLHPAVQDEGWRNSNDLSCVLRIDNGRRAALLTGDISQSVEFRIMHGMRPIHLLLAPHHGSRTSSSLSFLRRLRPRLVLVSAGFQNRFGHPHADRVAAWHSIGASVMTTAARGALSWSSHQPHIVTQARKQRYANWRMGSQQETP